MNSSSISIFSDVDDFTDETDGYFDLQNASMICGFSSCAYANDNGFYAQLIRKVYLDPVGPVWGKTLLEETQSSTTSRNKFCDAMDFTSVQSYDSHSYESGTWEYWYSGGSSWEVHAGSVIEPIYDKVVCQY